MAFTQLKLFSRYDHNGNILKTAVVVSCGLHVVFYLALSHFSHRQLLPNPAVDQPPLSVQLQSSKKPVLPKLASSIQSTPLEPKPQRLPKLVSPSQKVPRLTPSVPKNVLSQTAKPNLSAPRPRPQASHSPAHSSAPDLSASQLLDQARQIGGGFNAPSVGASRGVFGQTATGMVWDAYVDGWQRKVERIGQANYPSGVLPDGMQGVLTLSVIINQNGSLASVRVVRSSGLPKLDQAAMDIVKQAAPYAPFPPHLAQSFQTLEIKRRWRFSGNQAFQ